MNPYQVPDEYWTSIQQPSPVTEVCYKQQQIGTINIVLFMAIAVACVLYTMINNRNHQ